MENKRRLLGYLLTNYILLFLENLRFYLYSIFISYSNRKIDL